MAAAAAAAASADRDTPGGGRRSGFVWSPLVFTRSSIFGKIRSHMLSRYANVAVAVAVALARRIAFLPVDCPSRGGVMRVAGRARRLLLVTWRRVPRTLLLSAAPEIDPEISVAA